ncbi:MAG: hypothetical protein JNL85_07445 [Rubrivivax sp.]|nr:hypothetical protein [Rubrivivax sp.]
MKMLRATGLAFLMLLGLGTGLWAPRPAFAAEDSGSVPRGRLVSAEWLKGQLGRPDLLLLDASMTPAHKAAHIPGAVGADLYRYGPGEATAAQWQQRLQSWGLSPGQRIVVYDEGGSMMGPWLFFELLHAGVAVENLYLLDGGLHRWRSVAGAVTQEATPPPARGSITVGALQESVRVRLPEVFAASGASGPGAGTALIEALEPAWHFGGAAFFDRGGHIPNAVMAPSGDFYNADKTFKSADEIRRMMGYLGIGPAQQVLTYCGGGVAATVPFFALKYIADYPRVRVYKESQREWLADERGLPLWTYSAPFQWRESRWLAGWGSRMLRMYSVVNISIVDVRPPEAFRQGHLPFAVNVPAAVFRQHARSPARLAQALAQAGVKAGDEAVVFSDAGLTPEAALAYLLLESVGQNKVSVFADSLERWAELGYEVARPAPPATATGPATAAPAAPAPYAAKPRGDAFVLDAAPARGAYPKVYVAAGRATPASMPDGKVVRVPFSDLVTASGAPKPAKDLWAAISKAGVPRYAEVVLFADDPAEAAANYFLFRLMGFPDVKVWWR